ncbi:MAG: hypothetical protein AAF790_15635, partial [Planctomycetota bacterium]
PDQHLAVRVEGLRDTGPGQAECTLVVEGRVAGWARLRHYNRGVHLGTVTVEGESTVRARVACSVGLRVVAGRLLPAVAVDPRVRSAKVAIDDFRLERVSKIEGRLAREMGRGLKRLLEQQLSEERLTAKLNRAIDKRRDRLVLDPSVLAGD